MLKKILEAILWTVVFLVLCLISLSYFNTIFHNLGYLFYQLPCSEEGAMIRPVYSVFSYAILATIISILLALGTAILTFMMMLKKTGYQKWLILIIGLLIVLGLSYGAVYIGKQKSSQNCKNVDQTILADAKNSTTDWKTYENSKYGFSIKYPISYNIQEDNSVSETEDSSELARVDFTDANGGVLITITVNSADSSLAPNGMNSIEAAKMAKDAIIGGKTGKIFSDTTTAGYGVKINNCVYKIYTENKTLQAILETMVSTFLSNSINTND